MSAIKAIGRFSEIMLACLSRVIVGNDNGEYNLFCNTKADNLLDAESYQGLLRFQQQHKMEDAGSNRLHDAQVVAGLARHIQQSRKHCFGSDRRRST